MLKGGNAVISKATLQTVGPYTIDLGPTAEPRLFSREDEDMSLRDVRRAPAQRRLPTNCGYGFCGTLRLSETADD